MSISARTAAAEPRAPCPCRAGRCLGGGPAVSRYGPLSYGLAGAFLASWLGARDRPANALVIGSKWGYTYSGQWLMTEPVQERKDLSPAAFRRHLHETQHLLGEHLHPYQIHSATIDSGVLDDDDLLAELAASRRSGGSVGVTVTGPGQADTIDRALEVGLLRHRAGDVEPARTLRRSGAAARSRRWIGRHREGGSRQRPADDPRRRSLMCSHMRGTAICRQTRSRSLPRSRSRGRM